MKAKTFVFLLSSMLGLFGGMQPAFADDGEVSMWEEEGSSTAFSVTFSPLHLIFPLLEVTTEYRLKDQIGLAAIVGAGQYTLKDQVGVPDTSFIVIEVGAQFRYYLLGNFNHGMQVGAEVLFVHVSGDPTSTISATGQGLAAGPFVGYKIATSVGFTFDAQLGMSRYLVRADASDAATGNSGNTEVAKTTPIVNLNVGWSF